MGQFCFSSKPIMKSLLLVALAFAAVVVAEHEADAAADAWYGLWTSRLLRIRPLRILWWILRFGIPRILRQILKREAEAEAEPTAAAEADPAADAYYGYYGYGRPYGYYGGYY